MSIDAEANELIRRLQDIEDRLISDKIVEESVYRSIRTLERIFGKGTIYTELLERLKSRHKVRRLNAAVRRSIKQTKTAIEVANASARFPHATVNKNSFLADFLVDKGRLSKAKLREFHDFFENRGKNLEKAFDGADSTEAKRVLKEYIEVLEAEEEFLRANIRELTRDIRYAYSVHNAMGHEIAHWVFMELSKTKNIYAPALNEAYSFSLQKLMHTFKEDFTFSRENLLAECKGIYRMIVPRKEVPSYQEYYLFMRPFIIMISILILCDSIARKDRDYRNKKLFLRSYSATLIKIYSLIEEAVSNLRSEEFREIIRTTLLKTAISQLRKCKDRVVSDCNEHIDELPKFKKKKIATLGEPKWKDWDSLKSSLIGTGGILNSSTRQFAASLDLMRIMGDEAEAKIYRDRYVEVLDATIKRVIQVTKGEENQIYDAEKSAIEGVLAVIKEEEKDLLEIIHGLKF